MCILRFGNHDIQYINIFKITKKSITIQAMFVSLSRSKVLSSLALVAHFRVELCQIRGPIIKRPAGAFFLESLSVLWYNICIQRTAFCRLFYCPQPRVFFMEKNNDNAKIFTRTDIVARIWR